MVFRSSRNVVIRLAQAWRSTPIKQKIIGFQAAALTPVTAVFSNNPELAYKGVGTALAMATTTAFSYGAGTIAGFVRGVAGRSPRPPQLHGDPEIQRLIDRGRIAAEKTGQQSEFQQWMSRSERANPVNPRILSRPNILLRTARVLTGVALAGLTYQATRNPAFAASAAAGGVAAGYAAELGYNNGRELGNKVREAAARSRRKAMTNQSRDPIRGSSGHTR